MGKPSTDGKFRTTVSIDKVVAASGQARADDLYEGNFSEYVEALIRIDAIQRGIHVKITIPKSYRNGSHELPG